MLVVDSNIQTQKILSILLDVDNFKIIDCTSGKEAVRMCISQKPNLILLDLDLSDMDGKDVITIIREWSQMPIIVLSDRTADHEIISALNIGANDYVTKPFNTDILLARIHASLRNSAIYEAGEPSLSNGALRMDLVRHEVFIDDCLTAFTPKEYDLLRYFIVNCGKMLTHKDLLRKIWGEAHCHDITYLRVYIGQIREKIEENPSSPTYIITEPGIGYRMEFVKPLSIAA